MHLQAVYVERDEAEDERGEMHENYINVYLLFTFSVSSCLNLKSSMKSAGLWCTLYYMVYCKQSETAVRKTHSQL